MRATNPPPWHALEPDSALAELDADPAGLSEAEAAARLERHGPNLLVTTAPVSALEVLRDQLASLIVGLLVVAAAISFLLGDLLQAAAIAVVLLLNVAIGFAVEWRARRSMESLRRLEVLRATAVRSGVERRIDARELVPGDVVLLEAGDSVPADLRLLSATELAVDEASLTGESLPVEKHPRVVARELPLHARSSLVFKGTQVLSGAARGLAVATGLDTELGEISRLVLSTPDERTPLERRLADLGRSLVFLTLAVALLITLLGVLRGHDPWLMVETGIALAIAAVPEGLPVVSTIALAVGLVRMARRRALVRRLPAVEALGSTTIVCTDKTGTLTAGEMTVTVVRLAEEELRVSGAGYGPEGELLRGDEVVRAAESHELQRLLEVAALAGRARVVETARGWSAEGDPTEAALLVLARKAGFERPALLLETPEIGEVPFSSERKLMATFHRVGGGRRVFVKGAQVQVLERACEDTSGSEAWRHANDELAGRGLRVLALAGRELRPEEPLDETSLHDLEVFGLVGMLDPPAEGVRETIRTLREAGIRTVMITGDQRLTALAVGRDLGLFREGDEVLPGVELAALSEDELAKRLARTGAFCRTAPEQKLRIVRGFQAGGEIVAMLGDGVNDAAALKGADVGVAMGGRGTDVAKEAADIVLEDDRFETVATSVEGGRIIYDNIRKFVFYLFSCNLSEVLVLFLAGLAGLPLPLRPLQILWINLVTDVFPALSLALEPPEPDVMRRPPAPPDAAILSRAFLFSVVGYGTLMTASVLALFVFSLHESGEEIARTRAFAALGLGQLLHVFNARSPRAVLLGGRALENRWVPAALLASGGLLFLALRLPWLAAVLELTPLAARDGLLVAVAGSVPLVVGQLAKRRGYSLRRGVLRPSA